MPATTVTVVVAMVVVAVAAVVVQSKLRREFYRCTTFASIDASAALSVAQHE